MVTFVAMVLACGPTPGDDSASTGTGASTGASTGGSTGAEPTGGAAAGWSLDLGGCGGAYGLVVLDGGDLLVVGARRPEADADERPWAARLTADGAEVWSREYPEVTPWGAFNAVERVGDGALAVGVWHEGYEHTLLARLDVAAGDVVWASLDEIAGPSAMYGGAWSEEQQALWTAGYAGGFLGLARFGGAGALAAAFAGPGSATGFALGLAGDDVVVCGAVRDAESGSAWLGRFSGGGELLWSAVGPDPGPGTFSDCWDMAVGTDGTIAYAERGYKGARVAAHAADGTLLWEQAEPGAGAQAIAAAADGGFWVAGWSAARSHEEGDRNGWVRRYDAAGEYEQLWLVVTHVSPRDVQVHPDGGLAIAGERQPSAGGCWAPWVARPRP